jgi:hypothetical protein
LARDRDRHRRGGSKIVPYAVHGSFDIGQRQKARVNRGHAEKHAHRIGLDGIEDLVGLETLMKHHRRPGIETSVHDEILPEAVKKREVADKSIIGSHLRMVLGGPDIGNEIFVRQEHSLWIACRAGGVKNGRTRVFIQACPWHRRRNRRD